MAVSIVIPVYNRAAAVVRAVDSVFAQQDGGDDLADLDVVVVDDGSTDDVATALARFGGRVRLVRHATNCGAAAARNTGVSVARGDHIAFLDSDDTWLPEKLARQLRMMRQFGWRACSSAVYLVRDGRPEIVAPNYPGGALTLDDLVWGCFVSPGSTLVFERALYDEIGPLDAALPRLEDWDWLLRLAGRTPLGFVAEPLARVAASTFSGGEKVLAALEVIRRKHMSSLEPQYRRRFAAALDFERAAGLFRAGDVAHAIPALLRSLLRQPFGHVGLRMVLHNRRAD